MRAMRVGLGLGRQVGVVLGQLEQAALGAALGGAHRDPASRAASPSTAPSSAPSSSGATTSGGMTERRPSSNSSRNSSQHVRGLAPGGVLEVEGLAVDHRPVAHAEHLHVGAGVALREPDHVERPRARPRATDWRSCTWRTASSRSRSSAAFSNSCAAAAARHLALDVRLDLAEAAAQEVDDLVDRRPGTPRARQRSSHGPSERLMKYCRQGEPLGRPGCAAVALAVREDAADQLQRLAHLARARERAEVQVARHVAAAEEAHARPLVVQRDLDERVALVVAQAQVEGRALLLDEVVLEQQRLGLGGRSPRSRCRRACDTISPVRPWGAAAAAQVVGDALAQLLRLAHVEHRRRRRRESGTRRARWGCA